MFHSFRQLQIEQLNPSQIYAALETKSLVYIPLGAIEWHGQHLPIGLDSFTSHGICLRAASISGGLVMPPLYYGMTGSIWHHPFTILVEEDTVFLSLLINTLQRLESSGVKETLVFTGHFATRQLEALETLKSEWELLKKTLDLSVLSISDCPEVSVEADHGGVFETAVLEQLHPELVQLERLPTKKRTPANDIDGNSKGDHRRDPENVLFGIFGDDPRDYKDARGEKIVSQLVNWVVNRVSHI